jgi:hypothetical protein
MNDYCKGALEALAWVELLINRLSESPKGLEKLKAEVESAKQDILNGVGIDFRHRLRAAY